MPQTHSNILWKAFLEEWLLLQAQREDRFHIDAYGCRMRCRKRFCRCNGQVSQYFCPYSVAALMLMCAVTAPGLGRFSQAEEYLAQAEWVIMKTPECSLGVRHQLHRNLGRLHAATENFEEALFHLANDVYYASEEFGLDSTVACGGYILMANIFFKQKKFDIAMSLCTEVANTWHSHLYRILDSHIQNYSSLHNAIDEAQQAEADRTLQCVLELEGQIPTRLPSLMAVACHALAMLWLLGDDFPKATEFGRRALTSSRLEPDCGLSESIQRLLKMSEAGGGLQAAGMS